MIKKYKYCIILILVYGLSIHFSRSEDYSIYLLYLADKGQNNYSIDKPGNFLSERAIQRRNKSNIAIAMNDLPVSKQYIDSIKSLGLNIHNTSKWLNAVAVDSILPGMADSLLKFSFVKSVKKVYTYKKTKHKIEKFNDFKDISLYINNTSKETIHYGASSHQIQIHRGDYLHQQGYLGQGIRIAILDAGFKNTDKLEGFSHLYSNNQILGIKDFVENDDSVYENHHHGTHVLSIIGCREEDHLIGTAPEADFYLIKTEDVTSEYLIEEFNWVVGAEYADSAGADIINTSLGYYQFDDTSQNHAYSDMDGNTTMISRAADIAATKGMLVVVSAGNEGDTKWRYITAPADADSILSIGAIDTSGAIAGFSSRGPSSDHDTKPNIVAVGKGSVILRENGEFAQGNGTSYASPIISGLAACLWQAHPDVSNYQLMKAIEQSASRYLTPDSTYGFGIPDFKTAHKILSHYKSSPDTLHKNIVNVFPNPFYDELNLYFTKKIIEPVNIKIFDLKGHVLYSHTAPLNKYYYSFLILNDLSFLSNGMYVLEIKSRGVHSRIKIVKQKGKTY
jgi:subtilisin family serine protease